MIKKLISILTSCILAGSLMVGCSEDTTKNLDEKGKQALATTKKEEHDYKKVTELTLSNDYEDEYYEDGEEYYDENGEYIEPDTEEELDNYQEIDEDEVNDYDE